MNNDDFKEVPDNIQDNNGETTNNIDNTNDNKSSKFIPIIFFKCIISDMQIFEQEKNASKKF